MCACRLYTALLLLIDTKEQNWTLTFWKYFTFTSALYPFIVQLYCFEDRGNRRVALRPELTPSLARLVIQKGYLSWFCSCFCHESNAYSSPSIFRYLFQSSIFSVGFQVWCLWNFKSPVFIYLWFLYPGTDARIWSPCFFLFRKSVSLPLKWFAVGQCWRYERMTRGRRREHYQWNMDIIGVPEVMVGAANLTYFSTSVLFWFWFLYWIN